MDEGSESVARLPVTAQYPVPCRPVEGATPDSYSSLNWFWSGCQNPIEVIFIVDAPVPVPDNGIGTGTGVESSTHTVKILAAVVLSGLSVYHNI